MQPQQKKPARLFLFLTSPRGQRAAKWCAYGSLGSLLICLALMDYSRLAWPFMILALVLSFFGFFAKRQSSFAMVTLLLWFFVAQPMLMGMLTLTDMPDQQALLARQTMQFEHQHREFQGQDRVLKLLASSLSTQIGEEHNASQINQLEDPLSEVQVSLSEIDDDLNFTEADVQYDTWLYAKNFRDFPGNEAFIDNYKQVLSDNDWLLPFYDHELHTFQQAIDDSNAVLPASDIIQFTLDADQQTCVSGFVCLTSYAWQQPFIEGWQRFLAEPLAEILFFWGFWLLAFAALLPVLARGIKPLWVVTYKVAYAGPLTNLQDALLPEAKRQQMDQSASIVKVDIRSSRLLVKQKHESDDLREFARLSFGSDTKILDVFLDEGTNQQGQSLRAVVHEQDTDTVALKIRPVTVVTPQKSIYNKAQRRFLRVFPFSLYVVIDSFTGVLEVAPSVKEIDYLQKQRGPWGLVLFVLVAHLLVWWLYAAAFCAGMMLLSSYFFEGLNASFVLLTPFIISGAVALALVLWLLERLILPRKVRHPQNPSADSHLLVYEEIPL